MSVDTALPGPPLRPVVKARYGWEMRVVPEQEAGILHLTYYHEFQRGIIIGTHETIECVKNNLAANSSMTSAISEAVRTMKTQVVDVKAHLGQVYGASAAVQNVDITRGIGALKGDVTKLVTQLAGAKRPLSPKQIAMFTNKYGELRDTMREIRELFVEIDGQFESAQMMLMRVMGDDE